MLYWFGEINFFLLLLLLLLPSKGWSRSGLDSLLRRIDASGSSERKVGSGRPKSARTAANIYGAHIEQLFK